MPEIAARTTLEVNDSGSYTRTFIERDINAFADACGDYSPLHMDESFARTSVFGQRVAHGMLTASIISTVLGSEIPGLGTIFCELHIKFFKPVFMHDTITATATVTEIINPQRVRMLVVCVNQKGDDVAMGHAIVIPPRETRLIAEPVAAKALGQA